MTKDDRIKVLKVDLPDFFPNWPSSAVIPRASDRLDALSYSWFGPKPTERQKTLSRLTGRPWEDFIP